MAGLDVTITGVLYDKITRTGHPVVLIGEATLTGLGVGGGPMPPGEGKPPSDAHPEHPIYWPPGSQPHPEHPIYYPPGTGGGRPPHPEHPIPPIPAHPIVLPPDKPTDPPTEPPTQPADPQWNWAWTPEYGWHPAYVPEGGKPHPVPPPPA